MRGDMPFYVLIEVTYLTNRFSSHLAQKSINRWQGICKDLCYSYFLNYIFYCHFFIFYSISLVNFSLGVTYYKFWSFILLKLIWISYNTLIFTTHNPYLIKYILCIKYVSALLFRLNRHIVAFHLLSFFLNISFA